jgi:hypothetical protein
LETAGLILVDETEDERANLAFHRIGEQHLVRCGDSLVISDVADRDAAIRKH